MPTEREQMLAKRKEQFQKLYPLALELGKRHRRTIQRMLVKMGSAWTGEETVPTEYGERSEREVVKRRAVQLEPSSMSWAIMLWYGSFHYLPPEDSGDGAAFYDVDVKGELVTIRILIRCDEVVSFKLIYYDRGGKIFGEQTKEYTVQAFDELKAIARELTEQIQEKSDD